MLSLLFCLEVQTSQPTKILLTNRLVDGGTSSDTLSVVVGSVGPPIGFGLDVKRPCVMVKFMVSSIGLSSQLFVEG